MSELIKALAVQYEAEMAKAKANITVYLKSSVGIGEHPDLVEAIDSQVKLLTDADDKLTTLQNHYRNEL